MIYNLKVLSQELMRNKNYKVQFTCKLNGPDYLLDEQFKFMEDNYDCFCLDPLPFGRIDYKRIIFTTIFITIEDYNRFLLEQS